MQQKPQLAGEALEAAGQAAQSLWRALDGIEGERQARRASRDESVASWQSRESRPASLATPGFETVSRQTLFA